MFVLALLKIICSDHNNTSIRPDSKATRHHSSLLEQVTAMRSNVYFVFSLLLSWAGATPPGFVEELVATTQYKFTNTGAFATAPNGDSLLFLGSKFGQVYVIINPNDDPENQHLLMDMPVCTNGERGVQTVLPHPNFQQNAFLYVYRTERREGCDFDGITGPWNRLSRFTVSMDGDFPTIDKSTEISLFRGPTQTASNHNGGGMAFGNDGFLYVAIGDGGMDGHKHAQNQQTLNGAVLRYIYFFQKRRPLSIVRQQKTTNSLFSIILYRVTEGGDIPDDNPFAGPKGVRCNETGIVPKGSGKGSACLEIYAMGLRNPYRLAMDPNTMGKVRFFIGDVGAKVWEEINECGTDYAGANYGWTIREGPCKRDSDTKCDEAIQFDDPIYWYSHRRFTAGGAITGGAFVPNGVWPRAYESTYLFTDYTFGAIYHLTMGGIDCRSCSPPTPKYSNVTFHAASVVVDMFFGPFNDTQALYYLSLYDNSIRRVRFTGDKNRSPTAVLKVNINYVARGQLMQFNASESSDPDGDLLSFRWDFGDGGISTDLAPTHKYDDRKQYQVKLSVEDPSGLVSHAFQSIVVGHPPNVTIDSPSEGSTFAVGDVFTLSGSVWFINGLGKQVFLDTLEWEVQQHHADHWHPFLAPTKGNNILIDRAPPPEDYVAATNSFLRVLLTGTDKNGLKKTVIRDIQPRRTYLDFDSEPSGLRVSIDGSFVTTPAHVLSWEHHTLNVDVEDQGNYKFREWSSGPERNQNIIVPASDANDAAMHTAFFDTMHPRPSPSPLQTVTPPSEWPLREPTAGPQRGSLSPSESLSSPPSIQMPIVIESIPLVRPYRTDCTPEDPCSRCQGHCRQDKDCGPGLICFYKDNGVEGQDSVPGCLGSDISLTDWCTIGSRDPDDPIPLVRPFRKFCNRDEPCGRCEGHCFDNDDCEGDLVCFQKDEGLTGIDAVPGCIGEDKSKTDWCTTVKAIEQATLRPVVTLPSNLPSAPSPPVFRLPTPPAPVDVVLAPVLAAIPLVRPLRRDCGPSNPCGRCQGHCRSDSDCATGLICFYKDHGSPGQHSVPGCLGFDQSLSDWCTVGTRLDTDVIPLVRPFKRFCLPVEPCGRCEGHCFNDHGCQGDLVCFQKEQGRPDENAVPGCIGEDISRTDWCTTTEAILAQLT